MILFNWRLNVRNSKLTIHFAGHGRNFWELDSDLQNINRRVQNGFSCFRFLLGWQIFALLYNAAGQLHVKGEEAKYWVWIYWDSNQQRTFKRVQGPNNGKRRGSQNIDSIQRPCWKPYPWCGDSHLFFDTIVKPLEEKRGNSH